MQKHRIDKTHLESYLDLGRIFIGCVCFLLLVYTGARGQVSLPAEEQQVTTSQRPAYGLLRFDEDWSFLQNKSLRTDFWDPIKYIPLHCGFRRRRTVFPKEAEHFAHNQKASVATLRWCSP